MKRYDRSLSDFSEHTQLRLQPVASEQERGFGAPAVAGQLRASERLFAMRGALLDQEADPRVRHANVTRH
jgi:hypothetical protein